MKKTSWFKRFLWETAGADVSILEKDDCRTDHIKYTRIGATILMTAVFACFAGGFAAWFFTQNGADDKGNIFASIVFGLLWGYLIFNIDMALVVTLKKDPSRAKQKWIWPFVARAVLALLIAFMISIPLELFIFSTLITVKQDDYLVAEKGYLNERFKSSTDEGRLDSLEIKYLGVLENLRQQDTTLGKGISALEADSITWTRKMSSPKERPEYVKALNDYNREYAKWTENEERGPKPSYAKVAAEKQKWEVYCKQHLDPIKTNLRSKREERNRVLGGIQSNENYLSDVKSEQKPLAATRVSMENHKDTMMRDGNHFIMNFEILEWAVKPKNNNGRWTDLILLWIVRVIFFIIEIMPTVVKIITSVGSYDRKVYATEQQLIVHLASPEYAEAMKRMHNIAVETQETILMQQQQAEIELKAGILQHLKVAQDDIAKKSIDKWHKKESDKLDRIGGSDSATDEESFISMA